MKLTLSDRYFVLVNDNSASAQYTLSPCSDVNAPKVPKTTETAPRGGLDVKVVQVRLRPEVAGKSSCNLRDHMLDLTPLPADPDYLPRGCLWRFTADGCIMSALSPALNIGLAPTDHHGPNLWRA